MILAKGSVVVEEPVLDALFKYARRPSHEDALRVLREPEVQETTIAVAERMRHLAMEEDAQRKKLHKSFVNYRQFYVGGVGIGLVLAGDHYEWWVFAAVNSKSSKHDTKFCAEMRIMRAARETRCSCIGGLVVVGENQPDGRSGLLRKTIDPCAECRDCMRHPSNRPRFHRHTLILKSKPLGQVHYLETLQNMMAFHREAWP